MKIPSMIRSVLLLAVGASALQVQAQTLSSPADRDATARSAFATGDNTRAAAALSEAVRLNPFDPVALNNLAVNYAAQGDYQNAVALLERAQRLAPNRTDIVNNLANLKAWMAQDAQFSLGSRSAPQALNFPRAEDTPPNLPPLWAQPATPMQSAPLQSAVPNPYPQQPVYAGQSGAYAQQPAYPQNPAYAPATANGYPQAPAYNAYANPGYAQPPAGYPAAQPAYGAQPAYAPAYPVATPSVQQPRRVTSSRVSTARDSASSTIITERPSDSMPHRKKAAKVLDCPAP